jgi:hypothetical protein
MSDAVLPYRLAATAPSTSRQPWRKISDGGRWKTMATLITLAILWATVILVRG